MNPESPTYGALCLGTMGFQIAYERTADGREWDWRTFGTGRGFFADYIVAGTMLADRIRAGKLRSQILPPEAQEKSVCDIKRSEMVIIRLLAAQMAALDTA